jgi:hypothetical protein
MESKMKDEIARLTRFVLGLLHVIEEGDAEISGVILFLPGGTSF